MQERERLETEAEAHRVEKAERKAKAAKEAAESAKASAVEGEEIEVNNVDGGAKSGISIEVPAINDDAIKEEAMKSLSSVRSLHSKHPQSVGGTSKSVSRISKLHQRVQEINDKQKVAKWEDMLTQYFSEGIQEFNAMRNLRQRVCRSLNETQQKFI